MNAEKKLTIASAVLAMALVGTAASQPAGQTATAPQFGTWGFDLTGIDAKIRPGDSFFDYADGSWYARATIRPDKTRTGMFDALTDKSQEQTRAIIEDAAKSGAAPDTDAGKIGALYRAFMDEALIERLDAAPITGDLARIRDTRTRDDIAALMGNSKNGFGASLFAVSVGEDEKDPGRNTLHASQSGLGLPDRDYYLKDTFKDKKAKYRGYVARMLDLVDWPQAQQQADAILALETQIAEASWTRAESRDRDKTYNPTTPAELAAYAPGFPWSAWLTAAQLGEAGRVVVRQKSAFPKLAKIFVDTPVETLQAWQAFRVVDQTAPFLSKRFVDARFEFRGEDMTGQLEERARWRRGIGLVDSALGEVVGKQYVARYFPPESKAKMEEMVGRLKVALRGRIERLDWMTPETKAKALEKLDRFGVKIGYPDKWRDYSALKIDPADLVGRRAPRERVPMGRVGRQAR